MSSAVRLYKVSGWGICRFSPSMTSMVQADLAVCTPSHDHLRPVCLTERFISYEMRYAATL